MKTLVFVGLAGFAAALAASPATSTSPTPAIYLMTMDMHDGDRLVGSPKLTFAAGKPSKVEIGDAAGNHYAMSVTATPQSTDTVAIKSTIEVASANLHQTATPSMVVAFGKPSTIAFGIESPTSKPFRVDFTISKVS